MRHSMSTRATLFDPETFSLFFFIFSWIYSRNGIHSYRTNIRYWRSEKQTPSLRLGLRRRPSSELQFLSRYTTRQYKNKIINGADILTSSWLWHPWNRIVGKRRKEGKSAVIYNGRKNGLFEIDRLYETKINQNPSLTVTLRLVMWTFFPVL